MLSADIYGKKLVLAGVEYARKKNIKILPLCPFARGVFSRKKDLRDVLV
ncbi:N-acetyltransferase [Aquiflexum sp. TKW24L]|nr:N-acetyltransferase [Aquiflexum sp. TKW24L]MCL6261408.1 N-acetyltransferase [Aquiflexum sp. TKW24L]